MRHFTPPMHRSSKMNSSGPWNLCTEPARCLWVFLVSFLCLLFVQLPHFWGKMIQAACRSLKFVHAFLWWDTGVHFWNIPVAAFLTNAEHWDFQSWWRYCLSRAVTADREPVTYVYGSGAPKAMCWGSLLIGFVWRVSISTRSPVPTASSVIWSLWQK